MADISQTIHNPQGFPIKGTLTVTSDVTLTREDAGKLIVIDTTAAVIVTLPKTRKGYTFYVYANQVTSSTGHQIKPQADDRIHFKGGGAATDNTNMRLDTSTDVVGDGAVLVGDGNLGYFAVSVQGTWSRP
jgi:hypothetical protein